MWHAWLACDRAAFLCLLSNIALETAPKNYLSIFNSDLEAYTYVAYWKYNLSQDKGGLSHLTFEQVCKLIHDPWQTNT